MYMYVELQTLLYLRNFETCHLETTYRPIGNLQIDCVE